jgi:cbb3-type cytochrome oxidase maturation protein
MEVLFVLIPVSIALAAASVAACLVAIRGGQYDDLESPRWRILFDDRRAKDEHGATMNVDDEPTGAKAQRSNPL